MGEQELNITMAAYIAIITAIHYSANVPRKTKSGIKCWQKTSGLILMALLGLLPLGAWGQVYKCKDTSGKLVYSDRPCDVKAETIKRLDGPAHQTNRTERYSIDSDSNVSDSQKLDAAIQRAIVSRDFRHAKELALTPKHWEWIKEAEKGPAKTEANLRWEQLNSQECKQAQRSFDIQASSVKRDLAEIERKRQRELSACGGYIKAR